MSYPKSCQASGRRRKIHRYTRKTAAGSKGLERKGRQPDFFGRMHLKNAVRKYGLFKKAVPGLGSIKKTCRALFKIYAAHRGNPFKIRALTERLKSPKICGFQGNTGSDYI